MIKIVTMFAFGIGVGMIISAAIMDYAHTKECNLCRSARKSECNRCRCCHADWIYDKLKEKLLRREDEENEQGV